MTGDKKDNMKKQMIIRHQCCKVFALPTCSVRKTGEITDGACISLPSIRKTGLITDGASILPPCIRKIGKITDGASKIDVRPPDPARSRRASPSGIAREPALRRRRSFVPPAVLRWCHLHHTSRATAPASQIPHSSTCIFAETWNGAYL